MRRTTVLIILAGCMLAGCSQVVQPTDVANRGELSAVIVSKGPAIDGTLNDSAWQACPALELGECESDEIGELKSTARVLFDAKNLYIALECVEKDTSTLKTDVTGRDADLWGNDHVDVFIRPQGSEESRHFIVACNGELFDAKGTDRDDSDTTWDSSAVARVTVNKDKNRRTGPSRPPPRGCWCRQLFRRRVISCGKESIHICLLQCVAMASGDPFRLFEDRTAVALGNDSLDVERGHPNVGWTVALANGLGQCR